MIPCTITAPLGFPNAVLPKVLRGRGDIPAMKRARCVARVILGKSGTPHQTHNENSLVRSAGVFGGKTQAGRMGWRVRK
jgi:hypothetical protein